MIRNVVLGRVRAAADGSAAEHDRRQVEAALAGIIGLDLAGLLDNHAGWDCSLRDGSWDFAITNDWRDAWSYRNYDSDTDHNRYRQMIAEVCEQVARVQFEISDTR